MSEGEHDKKAIFVGHNHDTGGQYFAVADAGAGGRDSDRGRGDSDEAREGVASLRIAEASLEESAEVDPKRVTTKIVPAAACAWQCDCGANNMTFDPRIVKGVHERQVMTTRCAGCGTASGLTLEPEQRIVMPTGTMSKNQARRFRSGR